MTEHTSGTWYASTSLPYLHAAEQAEGALGVDVHAIDNSNTSSDVHSYLDNYLIYYYNRSTKYSRTNDEHANADYNGDDISKCLFWHHVSGCISRET